MIDFFVAVGLVFIFEGMILFISPKRLKQILKLIDEYSEKKIRLIGLFSITIGLIIISIIRI
ncbi:MAG: DUF2065 domain-containing protein [Alphaproteobacteria bacterium TMED93]|nr:MAG: DUF2065 domain-containing protein [Alphaproteobacteria bacterium TMED93]